MKINKLYSTCLYTDNRYEYFGVGSFRDKIQRSIRPLELNLTLLFKFKIYSMFVSPSTAGFAKASYHGNHSNSVKPH